ncbi:MAG: GNAT family N-acetyltransferase [Syntrophobacteraceae bacterium]
MTKSDIPRVGEILYEGFNSVASKYGYTPQMHSIQDGTTWAWAMFRHGPSERLVAELENRVVGMTCLNPRGLLGGFGPIVVDPHFQGKGIARELLHTVLKRADNLQGLRCVQEAYNPITFSLLYSFNYMPVANLLVLFLTGEVKHKLDPCNNISTLTANDLDELHMYDNPRSKFDRRTDFSYCIKWGKVFVYRYQSQIRGFMACISGSTSVQLGPLVAEGEEEAECLFRHALMVFKGRHCRTHVMARNHVLVKGLMELGFKLYCIDMLMVRGSGSWYPSQYVETFGTFPEGV